MGLEIERKFLLLNDDWKPLVSKTIKIKQGYLNSEVNRTVRIRIAGETGILTIKGKNQNLTRTEFEYTIPIKDALVMIEMCEKPIIEKTRFIVCDDGNNWEIDIFEGDNLGLEVAEIELKSEREKISIPRWIGDEVSTNPQYFNSSLIKHPFKDWNK